MKLLYSYLEKRITKIQKAIAPMAGKLEKQKYLASIKNGFKDITPVLLIGSFFLVFYIILQYIQQNYGSFRQIDLTIFKIPVQLTFGMLSIYAAIAISYRHAKRIGAPIIPSIFSSVFTVGVAIGGITTNGIEFENFNSEGLLVALIVSLLTVEVLNKCTKYNLTAKFKNIPEGSVHTFQLIMPIVLLSFLFLATNLLIERKTEQSNVSEFIFGHLFWGIESIDTPVMVFIIVFLEMLFWFIGINGYAVLAGFVLPFATFYLGENISALINGGQPEYIFTPNFWDYFASLSGAGFAGALVILALFSKVKEIKSVGKTSIIPSLFSITEPILYGLPITFNIYLFIPFVIGTPILATLQWYVFKWGFVNIPVVHVADAPIPIAQLLSTMDWRVLLLIIGVFLLAILMYYPFFKLYEKSVEQQNNKVDDKYADLDLDF
ncbi:PTS system cellobiose-specific IIC component [Neobacillus niacini]|uniref:PTS sugar transporter subunit IIC n=1 Tax=Neobacillus driksii TaxID=3035913 RepID=UPI002781F22C|nr:PTS transporter subunit EIIC [Neobacillus niacini]MDQ0974763.1 PTS system cellobiose-specific IIC component [Neobacillus niacini]